MDNTNNILEHNSTCESNVSNLNTSDVESQGPSLPLSILDVRSKALEEIQIKPAKVQSRTEPMPMKPSQASKLVSEQLDKGPFFGLEPKIIV